MIDRNTAQGGVPSTSGGAIGENGSPDPFKASQQFIDPSRHMMGAGPGVSG